jgi:hypothetical protein
MFGDAGKGIHAMRIPGTPTAAVDFIMTLMIAWVISASFKFSMTDTTIFFLIIGSALHWLFCVEVG